MKKITLLTITACLLIFQLVAQENSFFSTNPVKGNVVAPSNDPLASPAFAPPACQYLLDDGIHENAIGLSSGGDLMWLNSFTATAGCELITTVSLTWGQVPNGGTCRLILYDDPNNDGNPSDAVYLTEVSTLVANANTDIFTFVSFPPTVVSGGFFIAALYQNQLGGEYPAPLDQTSSQGQSWFCGEGVPGGIDVYNLQNNSIAPVLADNLGLPGNLLLRVEGGSAIPLSNWAIILGIFLIAAFTVYRIRRRRLA